MFPSNRAAVLVKDDENGSGNPDPTMRNIPSTPKDENVPPAGGASMAPADSDKPHATPAEEASDSED